MPHHIYKHAILIMVTKKLMYLHILMIVEELYYRLPFIFGL